MKNLMSSFGFALKGIRTAVREQRNMKIHLGAAMLVVVAGIYYKISPLEWCLVSLAVGTVITAELMNSSIESLVNMVEARQHPLAGRVKDIAAGGVLVAAICAAIIGVVVFGKYVMA